MIRVFVGCAANHEDIESQSVFEWSIRKHTSRPVEITWMKQSHNPGSPWHGWNTIEWVTPFSGFRWAIPEVCGFEGKAIYSDSDVIFKADIGELWDQPIRGDNAGILAKGGGSWRLCVSLWDCAKVKTHMMPMSELKSNSNAHRIMSKRINAPKLIRQFAGNWNCLDGEGYENLDNPEIKAIHYTAIANQPQLRYAVPRLEKAGRKHWYDGKIERHWRNDLVELFDNLLTEAKANGYSPEKYAWEPIFGPYHKKSLKTYRAGPRL